jgi:hypothetical protein
VFGNLDPEPIDAFVKLVERYELIHVLIKKEESLCHAGKFLLGLHANQGHDLTHMSAVVLRTQVHQHLLLVQFLGALAVVHDVLQVFRLVLVSLYLDWQELQGVYQINDSLAVDL